MTVQTDAQLAAHDHRHLNADLKLFTTDDKVGAGLPLWLPTGTRIVDALTTYIRELERQAGYEHVHTPALAKQSLYEHSGHWEHYAEDMFPPMDLDASAGDGEKLVLRPMACPHHALVFASSTRSWRELPLRLAEQAALYRNERSGVLTGLTRVRSMDLWDGHVFADPAAAADEVSAICDLIERIYGDLGITGYRYRLSLRDGSDKYVDAPEAWRRTQAVLRQVLTDRGATFTEGTGEAALYGPKIDVQVDGPGAQDETLSTVQLDAITPGRFNLRYADVDGALAQPWMIHRGLLSTAERMVAHLVEHHQGALPPWLAPYQAIVLPVTDAHNHAAWHIRNRLYDAGLHVQVEGADRSLGKRMHLARRRRAVWVLITGDAEAAEGSVTVRFRDGSQVERVATDEAIGRLIDIVGIRSLSSW